MFAKPDLDKSPTKIKKVFLCQARVHYTWLKSTLGSPANVFWNHLYIRMQLKEKGKDARFCKSGLILLDRDWDERLTSPGVQNCFASSR